MRWAGHVAQDRYRKGTGCKFVDWIKVAHDTVQWRILMKAGNKLLASIKDGCFLGQLSEY